jgi:hypothetical protein
MVVVVEQEFDGLMMPKSNIGICRRLIWTPRIPFLVIPDAFRLLDSRNHSGGI